MLCTGPAQLFERKWGLVQAEQLDASGCVKEAVGGDVGALQGSGSLPAATPTAAGTSGAAATAPPVAAPTAGSGPPPTDRGADLAEVQKLQSITGRPPAECIQALEACNGNTDAAAAMLLGL